MRRNLSYYFSCLMCPPYDEEEEFDPRRQEKDIQDIIEVAQLFRQQRKSVEDCREYIMNNFELDHLNFSQCRLIEECSYQKGGEYWLSAYDFPKEDDVIENDDKIFIGLANNVGIFTFRIVNLFTKFDEFI